MPKHDGQEEALLLARQILDVAQPDGQLLPLVRDRYLYAIGLLARTRRLLRAMCFLHEGGALDCAEPLARSILEDAATGFWLLQDPDANSETLERSALRDWRLLAELRPMHHKESYEVMRQMLEKHRGDADRNVSLPSVEERMTGPMHEHYVNYRDLCGATHSSLLSAARYLDSTGPVIRFRDHLPNAGKEQVWLPFAAMQVWFLAMEVGTACGFGYVRDLAEVGWPLNSVINSWYPVSDQDGVPD